MEGLRGTPETLQCLGQSSPLCGPALKLTSDLDPLLATVGWGEGHPGSVGGARWPSHPYHLREAWTPGAPTSGHRAPHGRGALPFGGRRISPQAPPGPWPPAV